MSCVAFDINRQAKQISEDNKTQEQIDYVINGVKSRRQALGKTFEELIAESRQDTTERLNKLFSGAYHG